MSKKVLNIKDDYMSHIIYLMNNDNLPQDEKDQIMDKLKELRKKEDLKNEIAIQNMSQKYFSTVL